MAKKKASKRNLIRPSPWLEAAVTAVLLAVILVIFAWPVFFDGMVLLAPLEMYSDEDLEALNEGDHLEEILPWRMMTHERLREGDIPLWNPQVGAGTPFLANNQSAVFSPTTWFFLFVDSPARAVTFGTLLSLFLAATALVAFLRLHGTGLASALVGGALLMRQGLLMNIYDAHSPLAPLPWIAFCLLALAHASKYRSPLAFPLMALCTGGAVLSGHLQIAYLGLIFVSIYLLFETFLSKTLANRSERFQYFKAGVFSLAVGLALGAVQILPTWSFLDNVSRTLSPLDLELSVFSMPRLIDKIETILGYAGLILMILGAFSKKRITELLAFLCLLAFAVSAGVCTTCPGKILPFFDQFQVRTNYLIMPFLFCSSALVAFGVQRLILFAGNSIGLEALLALAVGTLIVFGPDMNPLTNTADENAILTSPPCVEALQASGEGRMMRYHTHAMPPNMGMLYGLPDAQIYDSLVMSRYGEFMNALEPGLFKNDPSDTRIEAIRSLSTLKVPAFNLLRIGRLLSDEPLSIKGWELVFSQPHGTCLSDKKGIWVYRKESLMPVAYLVSGVKALPDAPSVLKFLGSPSFNPKNCALVEGSLLQAISVDDCDAPADGKVKLLRYRADSLDFEVESADPAFLVVLETYEPGWTAFVDGQPVDVLRADHTFRMIPISQGKHDVHFEYEPDAYVVGAQTSLTGFLIFALWFAIAMWKREKLKSVPPSLPTSLTRTKR